MTIFLSTHFMNEAERCDRMSMMHRGKVLAQGPPAELVARARGAEPRSGLHRLSRGRGRQGRAAAGPAAVGAAAAPADGGIRRTATPAGRFSLGRVWAFARREAIELRHDTVRLAFAVFGPLLLMVVFGYGISLDVEQPDLRDARLRRDRARAAPMPTPIAARSIMTSSEPLTERCRARPAAAQRRAALRDRDPVRLRARPAARAASPRSAPISTPPCRSARETARGYVEGTHDAIRGDARAEKGISAGRRSRSTSQPRALYNQSFESVYAHGAGRHHAAADADPQHADRAQRGAREGARLDRQFLRRAGDQGRSSCSASSCPTSSSR